MDCRRATKNSAQHPWKSISEETAGMLRLTRWEEISKVLKEVVVRLMVPAAVKATSFAKGAENASEIAKSLAAKVNDLC
jgi:hypothetical protein